MRRVKMIVIKTTTHSIDRVLSDEEIDRIQKLANPGLVLSELATEENIIDGDFQLDEFKVIEE